MLQKTIFSVLKKIQGASFLKLKSLDLLGHIVSRFNFHQRLGFNFNWSLKTIHVALKIIGACILNNTSFRDYVRLCVPEANMQNTYLGFIYEEMLLKAFRIHMRLSRQRH